jgi:preprotein translocase subunit SecD
VNESPPTRTYYYLMKYKPGDKTSSVPEMTGGDLKLSGTRQDFDPQTSQPEVLLAFTGAGRKRFHEITKAEAVRGRTAYARFGQGGDPNNFNQHFAIVLDRDIKSFPSIDSTDWNVIRYVFGSGRSSKYITTASRLPPGRGAMWTERLTHSWGAPSLSSTIR